MLPALRLYNIYSRNIAHALCEYMTSNAHSNHHKPKINPLYIKLLNHLSYLVLAGINTNVSSIYMRELVYYSHTVDVIWTGYVTYTIYVFATGPRLAPNNSHPTLKSV